MFLADFTELANRCRESDGGFDAFQSSSDVVALHWPRDVVEQWLYDHSGHPPFLNDYGQIDLTRIRWDLETLPAGVFADVPTGASEHDTIDIYAAAPDHWIGVRNCGIHLGVAEMWTLYGTWKRWPVLIDRQLLSPPHPGLQVVEGRTRVGILRGRLREGDHVADQQLAWVGRPAGS